jgi:hypothetical protein
MGPLWLLPSDPLGAVFRVTTVTPYICTVAASQA